jgi:hypothetical protein
LITNGHRNAPSFEASTIPLTISDAAPELARTTSMVFWALSAW